VKRFLNFLLEKLIILGKGKREGQLVWLVGGAGSGKGFARARFLENEKFKSLDVDDIKDQLLKLAKLGKSHPELANLNLRNPADVEFLHKYVKDRDLPEKKLTNILKGARRDSLPNLLFDVTLGRVGKIEAMMDRLLKLGYVKQNMHIVWVLTDYVIAVKQNQERPRIVSADILLDTHVGTALEMHKFLTEGTPTGLNGDIHVILGGKQNQITYKDRAGKPILTKSSKLGNKHPEWYSTKKVTEKGQYVIETFVSVRVKEQGKPHDSKSEVTQKVFNWIDDNAPADLRLADIFSAKRKSKLTRSRGSSRGGASRLEPKQKRK